MRKILFFGITIAFLLPVFVYANGPTIRLSGELYATWYTNDTIRKLELEATDNEGVALINIDWGDGEYTNWPCDGKKTCGKDGGFEHEYKFAGEYTIEFKAIDTDSNISQTKTRTIIVKHKPPTASLSVTPLSAKKSDTISITISGQNNTLEGKLERLHILTDDGAYLVCFCEGANEPCNNQGENSCSHTFNHQYSNDGYYTISAWVVDSLKNKSETKTQKITIGEPAEPPPEENGENGGSGLGVIKVDNPLSATSFEDFINKLVGFLFTISLIVVPILLIAGGIMFLTTGGDPEKARKAKKMVLYTLIGFVIITLARILVRFIEQIFE